MNSQLQNHRYQLLLDDGPIADVAFDGEGNPTLAHPLNVHQVRLFCAVMNLITGEYPPPTTDIILDLRTAEERNHRPHPPQHQRAKLEDSP